MQVSATEISDLIRKKIENFEVRTEAQTEGTVVTLTDGIVRIHGQRRDARRDDRVPG